MTLKKVKDYRTIAAQDWSLSLLQIGKGHIVTDWDDVLQCIKIILTTPKGTDPHRPNFGSDLFSIIDEPQPSIENAVIKEVSQAINQWEPRAVVQNTTIKVLSDEAWGKIEITLTLRAQSDLSTNRQISLII